MNRGEDLLCNRIKVKLKCAPFKRSNIFYPSEIFNFGTKLFPIVPPATINSCKIFRTKVPPAAEIFVYFGISREQVILDERANVFN